MNKNNVEWQDPIQSYIAAFIEPGMVYAWLECKANIAEIWYLCRKLGLDLDITFSQFQDTFLLIAENM